MSKLQLSTEEIRDFLSYLRNIKDFEKVYLLRADYNMLIIWALIFICGEISEILLSFFAPEGFGTQITWAAYLIAGWIINNTIKRPMFSKKELDEKKGLDLLLVGSIVSGIIIVLLLDILLSISYNLFIFPLIAIIIALYTFDKMKNYYVKYDDILKKDLTLVIPGACVISAFVNLLGYVIVETFQIQLYDDYYSYEGLIFIIFFVPALLLVAFVNKYYLEEYIKSFDS